MSKGKKIFISVLCCVLALLIAVAVILGVMLSGKDNGISFAEKFDRGLVVTKGTHNEAYLSWRFLPDDPKDCGFNVYRKNSDGSEVKLNSQPITGATFYEDVTLEMYDKYQNKECSYRVAAIIDGKEVSSDCYTLKDKTHSGCFYTVPIKAGDLVKNVWVGDLNGDGAYDYVLDRVDSASESEEEEGTGGNGEQSIEAYLNDGTFLWSVNLGVNSTYKYRIEPSATTIDVGHWDGVNVYDLDGDGKAEVYFRIANGVTFGDGTKFVCDDDKSWDHGDLHQWIARVDGMTGKLIDKAPVPDDFIDDGPMAAQFGVGFLDGERPSLVAVMKNRRNGKGDDLGFNMQICAYSVRDNKLSMDWQWRAEDETDVCPDGHHFRICDVDYDGKDEILEIGFCLNGDGKLRYSLADQGIFHGDRFYVGKFNKDDEVMFGYGIQQNNDNFELNDGKCLLEYYYNASTGKVIWKHTGDDVVDVGRGCVADIDPTEAGAEAWSFSGVYNAKQNKLLAEHEAHVTIWPDINFQWDGDLLYEVCNGKNFVEWDYENKKTVNLESPTPNSAYNKIMGHYASIDATGTYPLFVGDIVGDWRDEVIWIDYTDNCLIIFTTQQKTEYRIPTLASDRTYRSWMTLKGYKQGSTTSYYFGSDMDISATFPNV